MDARELDRAIDRAAGELIAREPSRALSYAVMARVRAGDVSTSTPRGTWLKVASCVCAGGIVVAYLATNRPVTQIPAAATPQVAHTEPTPLPVPPVELVRETQAESRPTSQRRRATNVTRAPIFVPRAVIDVAQIEPIHAEPIAVSPIEVPQLAREATSIETITIEPLTIEPLMASND